MKKIITIVVLTMLLLPIFKAGDIPDTACDLVYDATPYLEPGDGGQDYISSVQMMVSNSSDPGSGKYAGNFDVYDWNGDYIVSVYGDYEVSMSNPQLLTGFVDGTYTYVLDGTYKGTFDVDHEMQAIVDVDMAFYDACKYEYDDYRNPTQTAHSIGNEYNTNNIYNGDMTLASEEESKVSEEESKASEEESKASEEESKTSSSDEAYLKFGYLILVSILIVVLMMIILALLAVIFSLRKRD